ncbi:hypothetical protein GOODEAATRI_031068, partial [Goodea atripinnis]
LSESYPPSQRPLLGTASPTTAVETDRTLSHPRFCRHPPWWNSPLSPVSPTISS